MRKNSAVGQCNRFGRNKEQCKNLRAFLTLDGRGDERSKYQGLIEPAFAGNPPEVLQAAASRLQFAHSMRPFVLVLPPIGVRSAALRQH